MRADLHTADAYVDAKPEDKATPSDIGAAICITALGCLLYLVLLGMAAGTAYRLFRACAGLQ